MTSALISGSILVSLVSSAITFTICRVSLRKRAQQVATLQYDYTLSRTQLELMEQIYTKVADQIYNNVGQLLSLAKLNLRTADFEKKEQLREKVRNSEELVNETLRSLRRLAKKLTTGIDGRTGLSRLIEEEVAHFNERIGPASFRLSGTPFNPEPDKTLIALRMVQEWLQHLAEHPGEGSIEVAVRYTSQNMYITVTDNRNCVLTHSSGGLIADMRVRARIIGTHLESSQHNHTHSTITLSIRKHDAGY